MYLLCYGLVVPSTSAPVAAAAVPVTLPFTSMADAPAKKLVERSVASTLAVAVPTSDEEEEAMEENVEQGVACSDHTTSAAAAAAHARAASLSVRPPRGFAVGKRMSARTGGIVCPVKRGVGLIQCHK